MASCLKFSIGHVRYICPDDMAVRMRKVLARPWVGVRVCPLLFIIVFPKVLLKLGDSWLLHIVLSYLMSAMGNNLTSGATSPDCFRFSLSPASELPAYSQSNTKVAPGEERVMPLNILFYLARFIFSLQTTWCSLANCSFTEQELSRVTHLVWNGATTHLS